MSAGLDGERFLQMPTRELLPFALIISRLPRKCCGFDLIYYMHPSTGQANPFAYGQCTWWADQRYYEKHGVYVPWISNANAWQWSDAGIIRS